MSRNVYMYNVTVEIILLFMFLFNFRTRKWPDYFSVDIQIEPLLSGENEATFKPPILQNSVTVEWLTNKVQDT